MGRLTLDPLVKVFEMVRGIRVERKSIRICMKTISVADEYSKNIFKVSGQHRILIPYTAVRTTVI